MSGPAPGGVGYAKAAGNYGAAMYATAQAKKKGYDQVLWTDAVEHKYVQEIGTMNVFFIIGNKAITPDLSSGYHPGRGNQGQCHRHVKGYGINRGRKTDSVLMKCLAAYKAGQLKKYLAPERPPLFP